MMTELYQHIFRSK